ncbi:MAG: NUDIX hydrolase [Acidobacteriota bacterium]|nr:NUDIX hydrolase [Acidobacteriota bacterium]
MRPWLRREVEQVFDHPLFSMEQQEVEAGDDRRRVLVMHPTPWVNMIPLRDDGEVVLVRQWRFGTAMPSLEIPGGMVDPGEAPAAASSRELLEETGYGAGKWTELGCVHPNPAIMSNECWIYLAEDLQWIEEPRGDGDEEIDVESVQLDDIPELIRSGEITHSLVLAAFHLLGLARR